jgi:6-phosphogluconolactonase (cycloisomerase 2 family)
MFKALFGALGALLLAACGSGGGSHAEATPAGRLGTLAAGPKHDDAIVVYASEGKSIGTYRLDEATGTLSLLSSVDVVQPVQYGVLDPAASHLYVSLSDGATNHFVEAFAIDPEAGALTQEGNLFVPPTGRVINIDLDRNANHLLMAHNVTQTVDVLNLLPDGSLDSLVAQPGPTPTGNFAHQVRVHPSNRFVFTCARGTDATATVPEQIGQITVWDYDKGLLTSLQVVQPGPGIGPRHLDFRGEDGVYVSAERGSRLLTYDFHNGTLSPLFDMTTLADPTVVGQRAGAIHLHPNRRWLYVSNRNTTTTNQVIGGVSTPVFAGGVNEIALFEINDQTGEPTRVGGFDSHGFEPRTFTIDPTQQFIVVANQKKVNVASDGGVVAVGPNLSVFRIHDDGGLEFLSSFSLAGETLWVDSAMLGQGQ